MIVKITFAAAACDMTPGQTNKMEIILYTLKDGMNEKVKFYRNEGIFGCCAIQQQMSSYLL